MDEIRVDMRKMTSDDMAMYAKHERLLFELNHTMPRTPEYMSILNELFEGRFGKDSFLRAPLAGAASVVTHDVGDYEVAVGSPARVIKTLDKERFE